MVISQVSCMAIWLHNLLVGFFGQQLEATMIYHDNHSYINLLHNPIFHQSKHIDTRYYFISNYVKRGEMKLRCISKDEKVVEILTKSLMKGT